MRPIRSIGYTVEMRTTGKEEVPMDNPIPRAVLIAAWILFAIATVAISVDLLLLERPVLAAGVGS
jgi:hypothetical protein